MKFVLHGSLGYEDSLRIAGGPGSGWRAEDGHVPGSQGGKVDGAVKSSLHAANNGLPAHETKLQTESEARSFFEKAKSALERDGWMSNDWDPAHDGSDSGVGATYQYEKGSKRASVVRSSRTSVKVGGWEDDSGREYD